MNEAGTVEPGTESLQQTVAQAGGGAVYAFTLRPKRVAFQIVLQQFWVSTN